MHLLLDIIMLLLATESILLDNQLSIRGTLVCVGRQEEEGKKRQEFGDVTLETKYRGAESSGMI